MAQIRIHSAKRMNQSRRISTSDEVIRSLLGLAENAKELKEKCAMTGTLILKSPKVKLKIEEPQNVIMNAVLDEVVKTNRMMEGILLLGNIEAAEKTLRNCPQRAMSRRHPEQFEAELFDPLIPVAESDGFDVAMSNRKRLNESLAEVESISKAREKY